MATGIHANMLAELQGLGRVYPVFELTLGGTTYRFAEEPIASESQGRYEPFVQSWGSLSRAPGMMPDYSLQTPRTSVDIYDYNRVLQKAIGGPSNSAVKGSTAKIVLRAYHVALAYHYTYFDGVVNDYRLAGDRTWQFVLGPDDTALQAEKNNIPTLVRADWFGGSGFPASSIGADGQVVYGEHLSSGIEGASGMVNCTLVYDTGSYSYWYVSIGDVDEVIAVWRHGNLATSDFNLNESRTINGAIISLISDTTGTSVEGDSITVDVRGVKDNDGVMISDPVDVLEHFFDQFGFGAYPIGASPSWQWLGSSGKFNSTNLAAASSFLSNRHHECAKVITSSMSPISILNTWCKNHKMSPFWTWDWKLGFKPLDPAADIHAGLQLAQSKVLSEISSTTDSTKIVSQLVCDYLYREATNSYAFQRRVTDPDRSFVTTSDTFQYGESKAV